MKNLIGATIAAILYLAVFYTYYMGSAPKIRVYSRVLLMHTNPAETPHRQGQLPFLYVSWFHNNQTDAGRDYALYSDGFFLAERITSRGRQGGGGLMQDQQTFQALKQVSLLPQGLNSPDSIPHGRLLIVSLQQRGVRQICFYDRQRLPVFIQFVAHVARVGSS